MLTRFSRRSKPGPPWECIIQDSRSHLVAVVRRTMAPALELARVAVSRHMNAKGQTDACILQCFYNQYTANPAVHAALPSQEVDSAKGLASRCLRHLLRYGVQCGYWQPHWRIILEASGTTWQVSRDERVTRTAGMRKLVQLYQTMKFRVCAPAALEDDLGRMCVRMESRIGDVLGELDRESRVLPCEVWHCAC